MLVAQSPSSVPDNPFNSGGLGGMFDAAKNAIGFGGDTVGTGVTRAEIDDPAALSQPTPTSTPTYGAPKASVPAGQPTAVTHPHLFTAPHVNDMPIEWPCGQRNVLNPYNPTATFMLHNWCTQGLWDTYPAQRAAECARIQRQISGQCGCGMHHGCCGQAACAHGYCGGTINRYTQSAGCDSCGAVTPAAESMIGQPTYAPEQAPQVYEPPMVPTPAPVPSASVINPAAGSVASRPVDLLPPPASRSSLPIAGRSEPVTAGRPSAFQFR
ncbi:MAG: hypothetical protein U0892_02675 [Pirellulales bacterium]